MDNNGDHSQLNLKSAFLSDIGVKRKQNQDFGLARPDLGFFIVADGMGGHAGGEIASRTCVEKVAEHIASSPSENDVHLLQEGIQVANQEIYLLAQQNSRLSGMGTTSTILKISKNNAIIAQVGDSRAYLYNQQGFWQITRDHSLVQEKLRAGLISRDQLKTDEMKNIITRSVGYEPFIKPELFKITVETGDYFLLCSDGLSGPLDDTLIHEILEESIHSGLSLEDCVKRLIEEANRRGGEDNVTALLVCIE